MFPGYESEWIQTQTGIPQGSPLSPILFLFFISELLADFQRVNGDTLGFGFVDDTNLITWGNTAQENCQRLTSAHNRCIAWAKRHGAVFAPEKYQIIHFTRRRRHPPGDLASTVRINGHPATVQESSMRVLDVWVDPKLQWKEHIQKATTKGHAAFEALSRITASTWGPSMRPSRLIYTAVIRPTMLYGSRIWGLQSNGEPTATSTLQPIRKMQNRCLRRITGGYKRTPIAALERETAVPPADLYINMTVLQRAATIAIHPVEGDISSALNDVWTAAMGNRRQRSINRPRIARGHLKEQATERETEIQRLLTHRTETVAAQYRHQRNARKV